MTQASVQRIMGQFWKNKLLLFTGVVTGVLIVIHLNLRGYAFDDAYIHFRIATHLAEHGQPFFNLGEAVMASTSTGWTILLAILTRALQLLRIPTDLPIIVSIINAAASGAGAAIYLAVFNQLIPKPHHWVIDLLFYFTYLGIVLPSSIGLMEIPVSLMIAGLIILLLIKRNHWSLVGLGVLPFFRPELIVVAGLAILLIILTKRFTAREVILFTFIGATPFIVYELYFFRTLIPNTVTTKSIVYSLTNVAAAKYFIQKIFDDLALLGMAIKISFTQQIIYAGFVLWVIVSFIFIFCYKTFRQFMNRKSLDEVDLLGWLLLLWCLSIVSVYLYKRIFIFSWYDPLYAVPISLVMGFIIFNRQKKNLYPVMAIMLLPLMLGQISSLVQVGLGAFVDVRYAPEFLFSARVRNYLQVGRQLYEKYPQARLMTSEIGGIGYSFQGYIYDGVGLVSPEALKYHPISGAN
ncbi:MAG TPA: hypothetical protein VLD65_10255, partial [Anaerolineales bacterium]|nr:hypothetical protein [Anaerolineales bacterium]